MEIQNDNYIVLAAMKQDSLALRYASEGLQGDEDIVLAAVKQNGRALKYGSVELKDDRDTLSWPR